MNSSSLRVLRALRGSLLLSGLILAPFTTSAQDWPQFRGPNQDGTSAATNVPLSFSTEDADSITWKTDLPGRGYSSPVVLDGKIWVTTAVEVFATGDERDRILAAQGVEEKHYKVRQALKSIDLVVLCLDLATGDVEKTINLFNVPTPDAIHTFNSYASPTPVIEAGRLYCDFGTFGTACVETATGKILWKRRLELVHSVGPGSSPFLYGGLLILVRDGVDVQYLTALDTGSGETVWKTDRPPMDAETGDQKKAYCTPILITHEGVEQLIAPTSQWLVAYEPKSGKELWRLDHGTGFSLVPRPVYSEKTGLVYFCTGFGKPQLWAVDPSGSGDVTETHVRWTEPKRIAKKPSPLIVDGYIYILEDGGVATCLDAATGEAVWEDRVGGNYSASPLLSDGRIYLCSEEGKVTVIEPGAEYKVLAENELEDAHIMASPVPLDGALLIRTDDALYRFGS